MQNNTLSEEERDQGWRLLFDGRTLGGWRGYRMPPGQVPPLWAAEEGELRIHGAGGKGRGDILTVDQFADFELAIEWRNSVGGNSGIMYRVTEEEDQPYMTGPEFQILDNAVHPDAKGGPTRHASACYALYGPAEDVTSPVGEWNRSRIVVRGNHVEHWNNGVKTVEFEMHSPDWNARIAASKFAKWPRFARAARGHIDLQDHGHEVAFRNIKLREL